MKGLRTVREVPRKRIRLENEATDIQTTGDNGRIGRVRVDANKIDVLNLTERGLEVEEVNAVAVVQEIVEITLDSGAAKSVWSIRNKGATSAKATKTVRWRQQQVFRYVWKDIRDSNSLGTQKKEQHEVPGR